GGARGLGRGYALRLAGLGADVAIIDRNLNSAAVYAFERAAMAAPTVMAECEALGVAAFGIEADVADRARATAAIAAALKQFRRLDITVCNAGGGTVRFADERPASASAQQPEDVATSGTASDCSQEMLTRVLDNNLMATMYTCMAVAPQMKQQRAGKIITV